MSFRVCEQLCLLLYIAAASVIPGQSQIDNGIFNERPSLAEYMNQRQILLNQELNMSFESDVSLTENEQLANEIIMRAKNKELREGLTYPHSFNPSRHIFEVLNDVKNSDLFKIIEKMPKGGILHSHAAAMCSVDFLVTLTYWSNLWQCEENGTIVTLIFSRTQPEPESKCNWSLVLEERHRLGKAQYDEYVRKHFTLFDKDVDPKIQYRDINDVWKSFEQIFQRVGPMLQYEPVCKALFKLALTEMNADNVQYLEFRSGFSLIYDLNGRPYNEEQILNLYLEILEEFKRDNPDFIGGKIIYAPIKNVLNDTAQNYFKVIPRLHASFPNFFAGFDLVGQEDASPPLISFAKNLLQVPKKINFFIHAGETNWFGSTDENLIDAVLLGTKRIGHGFGLIKHPKLMEIVKQRDIAIEINPISNQVLKLVEDYRNHPGSTLLSQNFPIVVSSDASSFWEVTPLTHDFYMAFLGIASARSNLRTLKKLAKNSIKYSAMNETEKEIAFLKWQHKWDKFIVELIATDGDGY